MKSTFARQRGLSKFEFVVVAAVLGILAGLLLDRLVDLEREAERLEVELALRNLGLGLRLAISEKVIRGEEASIGTLLEADPLEWLGAAPTKVGASETAPRWHYDTSTHILSYRPRQPAAFDGQEELAWRLAARHDGSGRVVGLTIEALK